MAHQRLDIPESIDERRKMLMQYEGRRARVVDSHWYTGDIETSEFLDGEDLQLDRKNKTLFTLITREDVRRLFSLLDLEAIEVEVD